MYVCKVAAEWRSTFHKDVVVDLVSDSGPVPGRSQAVLVSSHVTVQAAVVCGGAIDRTLGLEVNRGLTREGRARPRRCRAQPQGP